MWKILSFSLITLVVGLLLGAVIYPRLSVDAGPSLTASIGKSRIGVAPRIISYQGYLKDSTTGDAVSDDSRTAVFTLYASDSGGGPI